MAGKGGDIDLATADRLFVTKVPQTATKEDLAAYFSRFGATTDVYLPAVPGHGGHKGIAFISYADPGSLHLAISSPPHEINGQEVVLDVAAPREAGRGQAPPPVQQWHTAPFAQPVPVAQPAPQPVASATSDRLFVTKVPPNLTRDHISEHFAQFGEMTDCYMPCVPGASGHKGIAFISYSDPSSVMLALQSGPHEVAGHQIVVDIAAPRGPDGGKGASKGGGFAAAPAAGYQVIHQPAPVHHHAPVYGAGQHLGYIAQGYGAPVVYAQPHQGYASAPPATVVYSAPAAAGYGGMGAPPSALNTTGVPVAGRLFCTRVTPDITKVDLQLYFQQFGQLEDVFVPSGGKGIAFVTFQDKLVADQVLQVQQHTVKPGKTILVDQAMDRPPLEGKGGGKGGRSGGHRSKGEQLQRWLSFVLKSGHREFGLDVQDGWAVVDHVCELLRTDRSDLDVADETDLMTLLEDTDTDGRFEIADGCIRKLPRDQRHSRPVSYRTTHTHVKHERFTGVKEEVVEPRMARGSKPSAPPGEHWKKYHDEGVYWWYYEGPQGKFWCQDKGKMKVYPSDILPWDSEE